MSISFADSLKKTQADQLQQPEVEDSGIATLAVMAPEIEAYAGDDWVQDTKYQVYSEYFDDKISEIDKDKNIQLDASQLNISQETNSQYIPFQVNRYFDGYDLSKAILVIHFVNKNGYEDFTNPINVSYNSTKIRFGWLVDNRATAVAGKVKFEIQAIGTNSKGDNYVWKTKPHSGLDVLESLSGNGIIEPDSTWMNSFLEWISEHVSNAAKAVNDAKAQATAAANYANQAQNQVNTAKELIRSTAAELEATVDEAVEAKVEAAVGQYYTKEEVQALLDALDFDDLHDLVIQYDEPTLKFYNGDTLIKDVIIYSDPSSAWTSAYNTVVDNKISNAVVAALGRYYTKTEVDELFANFDISDQLDEVKEQIANIDGLAAFNVEYDGAKMTFYNGEEVIKEIEITSYPSEEWQQAHNAQTDAKIAGAVNRAKTDLNAQISTVNEAVTALDIKVSANHYTKTESDTKYATKEAVENINTAVSANRQNIGAISEKITEFDNVIGSIDTSPRLTYEATYDEEQIYTLWEIEGEGDDERRTAKGQFKILGGGGGGGATSSVLKIEYVTKTPLVATVNDRILLTYIFSGIDSSGDQVMEAMASWRIGNATVASHLVVAGENTFDITDYVSLGTQKVTLSITDDAGSLVTKSWTVQKVDVRIESTFNDRLSYNTNPVTLDYTPYGAIPKTIHFKLDGKELSSLDTTVSGIPMGYELPTLTHGSHLAEIYMTALINSNTIESNHVFKDIIWMDDDNSQPVIGTIYQDFTALQYETTNIVTTVFDPSTENPTVELVEDGEVVSTLRLTESTFTWQYKSVDVGVHNLEIRCGTTVKKLKATIEKIDIEIHPVTTGLVFDFEPKGNNNSIADRSWAYGDVKMKTSQNFDWVNGGYQTDSNGDKYFCIKAGTSVEIDYQLFGDDAKKTGKEFKLIFKSSNVQAPDATFLTCVDNTTGDNHIGIEMNVHEAYIYGQAGKLHLPYSEEDIIEFEFNISKNTEDIPMVMGYEDGVSTVPMVYDDSFNFTQNTPKTIQLGSDKCDLHIYRFKVYNTSLTDKGILENFIADARNADEMIARYNRNKIYDENQQLDPDVLAEKCPWLRVIKLEAPYFTNNKSDKVPNTRIEHIYKDGDATYDNWIAYNSMHSGQGTSSNNYGAAGRNLDLIMNNSGIDGVDPYIVLGDGSRTDKITLTRNSVPVDYLNLKVNIASSENANNALLQKRYNEFNPYKRPFVRSDMSMVDKIKDTMEFYNAVVFIKESDPDPSTHREFADNQWHFYALGNLGDSKKTDNTRLTDPDDRYEFCVEIMDVEFPLSDWPSGEEAMEHLYNEKFDEKGTYGLRYIWKDGTDEENAAVFNFMKEKWIEMYRFVVESTDEEFKARLGDYFVLDSVLYYYLFTTRYTMVDNRRKNSFWHYGKTGEKDASGNPIRKFDLTWDYDNDTGLGTNNYGDLVYRYGLEDTDVDETGTEIFRESDSTFFCRLRDLFAGELKAMYQTLESKNAWHAESLINQFDQWQAQFPEELWRVDIMRKYIRTYNHSFITGAGDSQFLVNMAKGRKKYQRRQYERNQEKYMASKYQSSVASADNAVLRCTVPTGNLVVAPNYKLKITPYQYMYLNVKYGTQDPIQLRAEPNKEYEIPYTGNSADIIDVYSASMIQSLGDLSSCYAATVDTSRATKLKELKIGNSTPGYDNPSMTTLTLGANFLLETLNIENVSGLTQALNLSALNNLKTLKAKGSNITGVVFADGGQMMIAQLPAISSASMSNLIYLTTLDIESLEKLTTLTVQNCNTVDVPSLLIGAPNVNRVRLIGVDWTLTDSSLLERIYNMAGIDGNGYNIPQAVLTGNVHVPVIRQQRFYDYKERWPELTVTYDTMIDQFTVTFVNEDGTVLDVQYVDKGENAIDPTTRVENPVVPTKQSTVSHYFIFDAWDSALTEIFANRTIKATFRAELRTYTVKYMNKGIVMQQTNAKYGDNVLYTGELPTYTTEESAYVYYLFERWDKSGLVTGDKIIEAVYDRFEYIDGAFNGKILSQMRPVEIYAMNKMGLAEDVVRARDVYSFTIGNDFDFDDITSEEIISTPTRFDGTNRIDTGIQLFDIDKDFTLAIDFELTSGNTANSVLVQCLQANGSNGFKLGYSTSNSGARLTWGGSAYSNVAPTATRELIVIRHKKGDNHITLYNSSLSDNAPTAVTLDRTRATTGTGTLVYGCAKADDGIYENYGNGIVYWSKLWYHDLGDSACRDLAMWTHETMRLEACGFRKYYLSDNSSKRCSFSMLATQTLDRTRPWNTNSTNTGGWRSSTLRTMLNERLFKAFPIQIRQIIQQVKVPSSIGDSSLEITTSDNYITIPAIIELVPTMTGDPYINEGTAISYMTSNDMRIRRDSDGAAMTYWTRSPYRYTYSSSYYSRYVYTITSSGSYTDYYPTNNFGVVIQISL